MTKDENAGLACIGLVTFSTLILIGGSIMRGWVLSLLWSWFVVTLFHVPTLTIPYAIGISILIGMLTNNSRTSNNENKDTTTIIAEGLASAFFTPLLILGIAWIVKGFI